MSRGARGVALCGVLHTEPFLLPTALVCIDASVPQQQQQTHEHKQERQSQDQQFQATPLSRAASRVFFAGPEAVSVQEIMAGGAVIRLFDKGSGSSSSSDGEIGSNLKDDGSDNALGMVAARLRKVVEAGDGQIDEIESAYEAVRSLCVAAVLKAADAGLKSNNGLSSSCSSGTGSGGRLVIFIAGDIDQVEGDNSAEKDGASSATATSQLLLQRLPGDLARACLWRYTTLPVVLRFCIGQRPVKRSAESLGAQGELATSNTLKAFLRPIAEEYFARRGFVSLLEPLSGMTPLVSQEDWQYLYTNEFDTTLVCYSAEEAYDTLCSLFQWHCEETIYARAHSRFAHKQGSGGTLYLVGGSYVASSAIAITEWRKIDWLAAANWKFFPRLFLLRSSAAADISTKGQGPAHRQERVRTWVQPRAFLDCLDYDACPSRQDDSEESEASGNLLKKAIMRAREASWDALDVRTDLARTWRTAADMDPLFGTMSDEVSSSVLDYLLFLHSHGRFDVSLAIMKAQKKRLRGAFHPQLRKLYAESYWQTRNSRDVEQFALHSAKARKHWLEFAEAFRLSLETSTGTTAASSLLCEIALAYCRAGRFLHAAEFAMKTLERARNIVVAYEVLAHSTLYLLKPDIFKMHADSPVLLELLSRPVQELQYSYFACIQPVLLQQNTAQRASTQPATTIDLVLVSLNRSLPSDPDYEDRDPGSVRDYDSILNEDFSQVPSHACHFCGSTYCKNGKGQAAGSSDLFAVSSDQRSSDVLLRSLCIFTSPVHFYESVLRRLGTANSGQSKLQAEATILALIFYASFSAERIGNVPQARNLYERALAMADTVGVEIAATSRVLRDMYATFLYQQVFMRNIRIDAKSQANFVLAKSIRQMYEAVLTSYDSEPRESMANSHVDHARANYGGFLLAAAAYLAVPLSDASDHLDTVESLRSKGMLALETVLFSEDLVQTEPDLAAECWFLRLLHTGDAHPGSLDQSAASVGRTIECLENLRTAIVDYGGKSLHWDFALSIANYRGPLLVFGTGVTSDDATEKSKVGSLWLRKLAAVITQGRPQQLLLHWPAWQQPHTVADDARVADTSQHDLSQLSLNSSSDSVSFNSSSGTSQESGWDRANTNDLFSAKKGSQEKRSNSLSQRQTSKTYVRKRK